MADLSPLRRRMIEDMIVRNLSPATQRSYISAVSKLSRYFGRSPDRLELEDVRAFQVHLVSTGISWPALRILTDKGYRGHNAPPDYKFRVFISGPKARSNAADQARIAPQVRCRARHRPSQSRAPHGSQLPPVPARRRRQRRPRRRPLQLPPPDPLAQAFIAPNPQRSPSRTADQSNPKSGFFTDDSPLGGRQAEPSQERMLASAKFRFRSHIVQYTFH
jgi:hypothetical protein